jgi:hypothetical protein
MGRVLLAIAIAGSSMRVPPELDELSEHLAVLEQTARDSKQLGALPHWLGIANGYGGFDEAEWPPPDAKVLRALVKSRYAVEPRVQALAALWLSSAQNPDDAPAIEPLLDAPKSAGSFPRVLAGQALRPSYPIDWQPKTLGEIALAALSQVFGPRFDSSEAYRTFRREHPVARQSVVEWEALLNRLDSEQRKHQLLELRDHDPSLFLRVVLFSLVAEDVHTVLPDDALTALARQIATPDQWIAMLAGRGEWPELNEPARFTVFANWCYRHASGLGLSPEALLRLWNSKSSPREGRAQLAVAAARANPAESEDILLSAIREMPGIEVPLAELAAEHFDAHADLIVEQFFAAKGPFPGDLHKAVLATLASHGASGRDHLARFASDSRFPVDEPETLRTLVKTAQALGAPGEFRCVHQLYADGDFPRKRMGRTDADEQRAALARAECLEQVRAWLRTTGKSR